MNVLVLSDYGLSDTSTTKDVNIDDYIDMDDIQYLIYSSGYVSIIPYALKHEELLHKMRDMPGVDIYLAKYNKTNLIRLKKKPIFIDLFLKFFFHRKVQDPPIIGGTLIPEKLQYGRGDHAQDILIVARPSFVIRLFFHLVSGSSQIQSALIGLKIVVELRMFIYFLLFGWDKFNQN